MIARLIRLLLDSALDLAMLLTLAAIVVVGGVGVLRIITAIISFGGTP